MAKAKKSCNHLDKRCRNCGERIDDPRNPNGGWICPYMAGLLSINGPPWKDCRFWTKASR